jgi:hypothetical protein
MNGLKYNRKEKKQEREKVSKIVDIKEREMKKEAIKNIKSVISL